MKESPNPEGKGDLPTESTAGEASGSNVDLAESKYHIFPDLPPTEYAELKASAEKHGIQVPIIEDEEGNVIDGKHRKQISRELGIECPHITRHFASEAEKMEVAAAVNAKRRSHLNGKQKRVVIAKYLKADAEIADNYLGELLGVSKNTVADVREELEAVGQIDKLTMLRGKDGKFYPREKRKRKTRPSKKPSEQGDADKKPIKDEMYYRRTTGDLVRVVKCDGDDVQVQPLDFDNNPLGDPITVPFSELDGPATVEGNGEVNEDADEINDEDADEINEDADDKDQNDRDADRLNAALATIKELAANGPWNILAEVIDALDLKMADVVTWVQQHTEAQTTPPAPVVAVEAAVRAAEHCCHSGQGERGAESPDETPTPNETASKGPTPQFKPLSGRPRRQLMNGQDDPTDYDPGEVPDDEEYARHDALPEVLETSACPRYQTASDRKKGFEIGAFVKLAVTVGVASQWQVGTIAQFGLGKLYVDFPNQAGRWWKKSDCQLATREEFIAFVESDPLEGSK